MTRRKFAAESAWALLGAATVTLAGCGGGGAAANPAAASAPPTDRVGSISSNHGHTAVIVAAQLVTGGALELDLRGTSAHGHTVSLSATEVASIRAGARVEKESSGSPHTHTVVFNG
jgi:hypothetical protein